MRKLTTWIALAALLVFSTFAFTRMEASDGVKYRAQIAELEAAAEEQAARVTELEGELRCYEDAESSDEGDQCSSS